MINNITELLEKYDKIGFDTYENKEFIKGDWALRYTLKMSEMLGLQIILTLYYRKRVVHSWGCVDYGTHDNLQAIKWIEKQKRRIEDAHWKLEKNAESIGKELFNEL